MTVWYYFIQLQYARNTWQVMLKLIPKIRLYVVYMESISLYRFLIKSHITLLINLLFKKIYGLLTG